eukprot:GEMP01004259.1.p1 GENE.GEMP01004259.1~~GEMP01004259.1.p1  ORF type:complete len:1060 (+),score=211.55 GEMP01004259.1:149-3328(+)
MFARGVALALWSTPAAAKLPFIDDALQKGPPACMDGGPFIFTPWASDPADFQTESYSSIESVLYHHPDAKLLVLGTLPADTLEVYRKEGYCALPVPVDFNVMQKVVREITGLSQQQLVQIVSDGSHRTLAVLWQAFIVCVQHHYGGIYLPQSGMLLGSLFAKVPHVDASSRPIFFEWILPQAMDWGLTYDDIAQPRSHTDIKPNETAVCWDWQICLSYFPNTAQALTRSLAQRYLHSVLDPGLAARDPHEIMTSEMRPLLQKQEVVLLPFWMFLESHFPDHYVEYSDEVSDLERHSQLYAPRPHREQADWMLVHTNKLWVPFSYGPRWARGALKNSVMDLAFSVQSLHLSPMPYKTLFYTDAEAVGDYSALDLHDPTDIVGRFLSRDVLNQMELRTENMLPGIVGGFRSFGRTRVVGKTLSGKVVVRIRTTRNEHFFCRVEARSVVISAIDVYVSSAFTRCQSGVQPQGARYAWSVCGSIQEVNAAINLLSYRATNTSEPFALAVATLGAECLSPDTEPTVAKEWLLLQEDVDKSITVAAHSGGRCDLVTRMAESLQLSYPNVSIIATCECEEGTNCNYETTRPSPSLPLTVYNAPYDAGLSRGKMFLTSAVTTEFILILDDDFVLSTHSCLECMALHLRSNWHSHLLPLDIIGFPVLEDERNFGAYRGTMRIKSHRLLLEPFTKEHSFDGCFRVDFCPMVYLARTERMRMFKWKPELKVGEHEHFFYTNMRQGITTAVCFDSSFAHARMLSVNADVQGKYKARRDRFMELMLEAFGQAGVLTVMYNFHKYSHQSTRHFEILLEKHMEPWHVRDDTAGSAMEPVASMMLTLIMVFSPPENEQYRMYLRSPDSWLQKLNGIVSGVKPAFAFVVPIGGGMNVPARLEFEMNEFKDMIFFPGQMIDREASGEMLKFLFTFIGKRFQFRWLMVTHDDVYVNADIFVHFMGNANKANEQSGGNTILAGRLGDFIDGLIFVMPRDLALLLTYPQILRKLSTARTATETLNRWLGAIDIKPLFFPAITLRSEGNLCSRADAWIVHPAPLDFMTNASAREDNYPCAA